MLLHSEQFLLKLPQLEELGMPPIVTTIAEKPRGLVLVTGPTGSGKSTTLAAMIDYINRTRAEHILTIEDPVEFVHTSKVSVIHQRELGLIQDLLLTLLNLHFVKTLILFW